MFFIRLIKQSSRKLLCSHYIINIYQNISTIIIGNRLYDTGL